jgi:hypothetical protein
MALPGPTQFQKRQAARRRTGDITRLAQTYAQNVEALTQDYERAFGQFTQQREAQLAPYEQAVGQYQSAFDVYQQQAEDYRQKSEDFQRRAASYESLLESYFVGETGELTPVVRWTTGHLTVWPTRGYQAMSESDWQRLPVNTGLVFNSPYEPTSFAITDPSWEFVQTGSQFLGRGSVPSGMVRRVGVTQPYESFEKTAPGPFTETAPVAPVAPEAPQLSEFDSSQFEARRAQLESEFQRELGERRGARMTAVSRRRARPLLQGQA